MILQFTTALDATCRRYTKHMYVLPLVIIFKTIYVRNLPKRLLWMGNIYHDPIYHDLQVMMAGGIKKTRKTKSQPVLFISG
jgi:hypothetical protein